MGICFSPPHPDPQQHLEDVRLGRTKARYVAGFMGLDEYEARVDAILRGGEIVFYFSDSRAP